MPPETLAPVLRQLVDSFVHDRARPEVMTLGLKTVRELCMRAPLVMTPELLQVRLPLLLACQPVLFDHSMWLSNSKVGSAQTPQCVLPCCASWPEAVANTVTKEYNVCEAVLCDICAGPGAIQEI